MKKNSKWIEEFGAEYKVPAWVSRLVMANKLVDASWHNDSCPAFDAELKDGTIRLWVEHPNKDKREFVGCEGGARRFVLCRLDESLEATITYIETDNSKDAERRTKVILDGAKNLGLLAEEEKTEKTEKKVEVISNPVCPECGKPIRAEFTERVSRPVLSIDPSSDYMDTNEDKDKELYIDGEFSKLTCIGCDEEWQTIDEYVRDVESKKGN